MAALRGMFFVITMLLTPVSLFANIPEDCCKLEIGSHKPNPLLKMLPDLEIPHLSDWEGNLSFSPTVGHANVSSNLSVAQYAFVDQEILFFQTRFKERFERSLARSGRYLPMIKKSLQESGLPEDIIYLPLIESGFNPVAVSRAKAAGLWQFMRGTARQYGLRVDRWIDERYNAEKSTKAAMEYLSDLYVLFGSWPLSMASYNAGEGRIGRAITAAGVADYWALKDMEKIPRETRDYIPKFMAAAIIAKDPESYGFSVEYQPQFYYDRVQIKRQTSLQDISRATGISVAKIREYNPELRKNTTPPNYPGYLLKLPVGGKDSFVSNYAKLERSTKRKTTLVAKNTSDYSSNGKQVKHKIKRGETLDLISKKYNVATKKILHANRLKKGSVIRAGRSLLIPS
jgi:membrane-bound lytic murein transglycosylase D